MDKLLGEEIGHGAYGHVHIDNSDSSKCIKMSNKQNDINHCRQWSNEYKKIKTLLSIIEEHPSYKKIDYVRIVKPTDFIESDTVCYMKMTRIFRAKKIDNEEKEENNRMIQSLLGDKNTYYDHKGRGLYMGLKHLKEYIDDNDLLDASHQLGIMMGLIHYTGKCNAFDIEVFLGREYSTRKNRFYIADFDMTSTIDTYGEKEIQEMYCSLNDASYFPRPSINKKLFEMFYDGYCSIVPKTIVERVFRDYS
jgi:hypothetical protein